MQGEHLMAIHETLTMIDAPPASVLATLTDPETCLRWAPIPFLVEDLETERLEPGSTARLGGRLAGREVMFDIEVERADEQVFALRAQGPFDMSVRYELEDLGGSTAVTARIGTGAPRGLTGRLLQAAVDGLASAGLLEQAAKRLGREAQLV